MRWSLKRDLFEQMIERADQLVFWTKDTIDYFIDNLIKSILINKKIEITYYVIIRKE